MTIDTIVYFGASWTDDGNLTTLLGGSGGGLGGPYVGGTLTDGQVYSEILDDELGVVSENYAIGGAKAIGLYTLAQILDGYNLPVSVDADAYDVNLQGQVDRFLESAIGDLSETAASIFIGNNDFLEFQPSGTFLDIVAQTRDFASELADSITAATADLVEAGVGTIVHYNLPSASFYPALSALGDEYGYELGDGAAYINTQVEAALAEQVDGTETKLEVIDLNRLTEEVSEDPETFGFIADLGATSIDDGAYSRTPSVEGAWDADQYLFLDGVHPTTAFHGVLAAFTEATLTKDELMLGDDADAFRLGEGDSFVFGGAGKDNIRGEQGEDILFGGLDGDKLRGGGQDDIISGGGGGDRLWGGSGKDILSGGNGNDKIYGGAGADLLIGGLGYDSLYGDNGDDTFVFVDPALLDGVRKADTFDGGSVTDTVYVVLEEDSFELISAADDVAAVLNDEFGLVLTDIENIVLTSSREELAEDITELGYGEADLWGFV